MTAVAFVRSSFYLRNSLISCYCCCCYSYKIIVFQALIGIENPTFTPLRKTPSSIKGWGLIKVQLHTKSLQEMKIAYKELDAANLHSGVDDALLESSSTDSFPAEWNKLGRKVIQQGSALAARQYAKYGCPPGLRKDLWKLILCYEVDDVDRLYFQQLKQYVIDYDMLVDSLITKDIKLTAANDDNYFVFEDVLCQALLVFSRDTSVLKHFDQSSATPPKSYIRGKLGVQDYAVVYPPNGFIPFHGFSLYAAPLGFVCSHAPQLYYLFKQIYTRYFFRLHTMSSHPQVLSCVIFSVFIILRSESHFILESLSSICDWSDFAVLSLLISLIMVCHSLRESLSVKDPILCLAQLGFL
ncbi:PREDICTED: TBC1 domain family member 19-like, partial [Acropora digitifera]|uniref:TBC1 domain family member 19-like n=1 Tax=Acropora digitifera TaxID=70779 RepID=UPI00077AD704